MIGINASSDAHTKPVVTAPLIDILETNASITQIPGSKGSSADPTEDVGDVVAKTPRGVPVHRRTTGNSSQPWHSSEPDYGQQEIEDVRVSSGKKRMLMTFSSDEEEVSIRSCPHCSARLI